MDYPAEVIASSYGILSGFSNFAPPNTGGYAQAHSNVRAIEFEPEPRIDFGPVVQEVLTDTAEIRKRVVGLLKNKPGSDQMDIADDLGISLPLAVSICKELESLGFIRSR